MAGLDFSGTLARGGLLLDGAIVTLWISAASMAMALALGTVLAFAMGTGRAVRYAVLGYVELIRNTPFLVQLFVWYFGLPAVGLSLSPTAAALVALTIYGGAYLTEIVRAGIDSVAKGPIEGARALGLRTPAIWRHVVLVPATASIFPALTGQFVLLLQTSSLLSAISVAELTGEGNSIQNLTFRNFEGFILVAAIYIALSTLVRLALVAADRGLFPFKSAGH